MPTPVQAYAGSARLTTRWLLSILLVGAVSTDAETFAGEQITLQAIVEHNTRARGGRLAIESVEWLEYELVIEEPTFTVDAVYRVDRQGRMRIDIYADGERVFTEGYDGEMGWQWPKDTEHGERASADGEAALRHGPQLPIHILGLDELPQRGHTLTLEGEETLDDHDYLVLRVTLEDGYTMFYYVDPASWLIVRSRDFRAYHPDIDAEKRWHESRYSDFREVAGVTKAFVSTTIDIETGETVATTTVKTLRANPPADPAVFDMP